MLPKLLGLNLALVVGLLAIGYFPALFLERKFRPFSLMERAFVALLSGYFLFQTAVAIWVTSGETVQWVNLFPFLALFLLPDWVNGTEKQKNWWPFLFPAGILGFSVWYFVHSYSSNGVDPDSYPFIDIVSYATTATGMMISGNETVFADGALYYPHLFPFSLYHFTELWTLVGISQLAGITPLFGIAFLVPVLFLLLISLGLISVGENEKRPLWLTGILIFSFLFANGKLVMGNDIFLFNILDLCGLKISLLIPILLFLWIIRGQTTLLLAFSMWLPQANILYAPVVGFLWIWVLVNEKADFFLQRPIVFWVFPALACLLYGLLLFQNPGEGNEFELLDFSTSDFLIQVFHYLREAVMNLGFQYWLPLLVLSAVFVSGRNAFLLLPFLGAKGVSKLLLPYVPLFDSFAPIIEMLIFLLLFGFVQPFLTRQMKFGGWMVFSGLFILSAIGAAGHTLTGFMDFEQIYTLMAASVFFLITFSLFNVHESRHYLANGIFPRLILGGICLMLVAKTFRFQRVLPFSNTYFSQVHQILNKTEGSKRSAYFSTKSYYPFPLHVQAGFPLLFSHADALSTPVTMLEPNNWQGTSRENQVKNFAFMMFAQNDSLYKKDGNIPSLQIRFLKHFGIRYLWMDKDYHSEVISQLLPYRKNFLRSPDKGPDFWEIEVDNLK